ncbi:MAG: major capsid protein [Aeromicrobium sp.]
MLWTDLIDPADLSGYARESLADYEARQGTLAVFLPNREVADVIARFVKGATGLIEVAKFRAYDAEPEVGARQGGKRVTLELPALGQNIPVSEYDQLRARGGNVSDQAILDTIYSTTDTVVRAVADAIERMRGIVLTTGKATISQDNFVTDDDFGRAAGHTVTAPALWSVAGTDAIAQLQGYIDTYVAANGTEPGALLMNRRAVRALAGLDQFKTTLVGGASRPATLADVNDTITAEGLPPIVTYNRQVKVNGATVPVIPTDRVIMLPAPVAADDAAGTELGATFWGRTLTSMDPDWNIESDEQPGLVAGVWKHPKPPMGLEVISDAIGLPVLANADLSFAIDVL